MQFNRTDTACRFRIPECGVQAEKERMRRKKSEDSRVEEIITYIDSNIR